MNVAFHLLLAALGAWQSNFALTNSLGVAGSNPYFILRPGYSLVYRHADTLDRVTVLDRTKRIDGVQTRVVEDRESVAGHTSEITLDYYAIDARTGDVYYFGEDATAYARGKILGHQGSWRSGVRGARFGLMMPGAVRPGEKFYQEHAPAVGMDRAEVLSVSKTIATPAGTFQNCVYIRESSSLEPGTSEYKWYARGVGPVQDDRLSLISYKH